jgi:hypothetical protein
MSGKNLFPVKDLATTFKERSEAFCNRSSCLFPAYLSDEQDTHLVFLNYWTIKNNIQTDNLLFNIRLRDSSGELVQSVSYDALSSHNQISIKSILQTSDYKIDQKFFGTVELEIISTKNLRYAFPAVTVIYQSGNLFSAAHSAGRIKNSDESHYPAYSCETNWNCKFSEGVTPFFHYFVGPSVSKQRKLEVSILNFEGRAVRTLAVDISHLNPFGCETFFADSLFDVDGLDNSYFMSVKVEHNSIYPRLIVGNYFKSQKFFEVTHSYPFVEDLDYCPLNSDTLYQSTICAFRSQELDLVLRSFPTFNRPEIKWDTYVKSYDQPVLQLSKSADAESMARFMAGRDLYAMQDSDEFVAFCLKGEKTPARMTISYQYSVRGVSSSFSTDISDGAKACIFPGKFTFWGHGLISDDFETLIFLRNKSHSPSTTKFSRGRLRVFSNEADWEFNIEINPETLKVIKLKELISRSCEESKTNTQFLSWILNMEESTCDTFWVSFDRVSGNVFGDHGF